MEKTTPIPLRNTIDTERLCSDNPCENVHMLGSFWPSSRTSFESHIVKGFKNSYPTTGYEPGISHLCRFYRDLVVKIVQDIRFDWIVRVLSSSEVQPDLNRPQSLLINMISNYTGAKDLTHLFFKSSTRPPMRYVDNLSGPDSLKRRIQYVSQDLFIRPANAGGRVLLIDDIYNTGASTRVYAYALKEYAGIQKVYSVNLAATRFKGGKDGHGLLKLDISGLEVESELHSVWQDKENVYHAFSDCEAARSPLARELLFIARKNGRACCKCLGPKNEKRKWWQF